MGYSACRYLKLRFIVGRGRAGYPGLHDGLTVGHSARRYLELESTVGRGRAGYPEVQMPTVGRPKLEGEKQNNRKGRDVKQATLGCQQVTVGYSACRYLKPRFTVDRGRVGYPGVHDGLIVGILSLEGRIAKAER